MRHLHVLALALVSSISACNKSNDNSNPPLADMASVASPVTSAATPMVADSAQIPTEEDFEVAAEKAITASNLNDELAKLQKEIDQ